MAVPLRSSSTAAPLRQFLYSGFPAAATGFRPLTPSWSFCDVKPLHPRQLACASAGVQLLSVALIAVTRPVTRPLLLSHGPYCRHTALIAVIRPLPAKAHEAWQSAGFLPVLYLLFCSLGPSSPADSAVAESGGPL
jgi:hypothetical protein